jgi:hypothetical protein
MKKWMLMLMVLGTGTLFAQMGTNGYYGTGGGHHGGNGYQTVQTTYPTTYGGGYNTGNGYYGNSCAPQTRVRWEASPCGTFSWQVNETAFWVPGRYVVYNGCSRWQDGYYDWRCTGRRKVYNRHTCSATCGHGHGHGNAYGHGNGHGHGHGHGRR